MSICEQKARPDPFFCLLKQNLLNRAEEFLDLVSLISEKTPKYNSDLFKDVQSNGLGITLAKTYIGDPVQAVIGAPLRSIYNGDAVGLGEVTFGLALGGRLARFDGSVVANKPANLFLDEISTTWKGHESAVVDGLQSVLGKNVAPKVYLRVETSSGNAYIIIPDALERSGSSFVVHDAKFSSTKDLMNLPTEQLRNTFTVNQKPAFDDIAAGEAKVTLLNSQGGRALLGRDFQVGMPINVQPSINLYVNTPSGIVKRTWP